MTVKQISVFLENKPGKLSAFTHLLRENGIDMRALSIVEEKNFGILRVIVDDVYETSCVLKDADYVFKITPVIAVALQDVSGGLSEIADILGDNGVNIEYMYAFTARKKDTAYMVFRVEDNEKAIDILTKHNITPLCQSDLAE